MFISIVLQSNTGTITDRCHNFEPGSSDDNYLAAPSRSFHTDHKRVDLSFDRFNVNHLFTNLEGDNACAVPIMANKDILEFAQSSKHILDADSDDENEMTRATPVPTPSERGTS
ncbi:hypothetical protein TNCV_526401 [Trichonephila clavipes]|nr:hypothetical protein TNCV_526401 [Trichonephila clavipes]